MAVIDQTTAEFGREVQGWARDANVAASGDVASRRVDALARAALVSASLKARTTADSILANAQAEATAVLTSAQVAAATRLAHAERVTAEADANAARITAEADANAARITAEADSVLLTALTEADLIRADVRAGAERDASVITDRALDQRDLLLTATLERIAGLTHELIGMADQVISHADDPGVARTHLAHFMLTLTDMAGRIESDSSEG